MNDITNITTTNTEVAEKPVAIFDGKAYAVSVFEPFKKQIAKAKREADKTEAYDITTGAGMAVAKELRASFRDIRISIDNTRKDRKAPIIEAGKLLDSRAKELTAEVEPLEDKYDAQIKAEEARKAAEKARREAEERARVEAIEGRVANIRSVPAQVANADSSAIRKQIDHWTLLRLDPADYQEYLESALTAVNTTLDQLGVLLAGAEAREAEARRVAEERAELARLKAEQAEREAKAAAEAADRERVEKQWRDAAAERERKQAEEMETLRQKLAAMTAAAAAQPPAIVTPVEPVQPGAGQPTMADIEEDGTGLVVGQVVMVGDTVPTEELPINTTPHAQVQATATRIKPRPEFGEVVEVLATHYETSEETVIAWLNSYCMGM